VPAKTNDEGSRNSTSAAAVSRTESGASSTPPLPSTTKEEVVVSRQVPLAVEVEQAKPSLPNKQNPGTRVVAPKADRKAQPDGVGTLSNVVEEEDHTRPTTAHIGSNRFIGSNRASKLKLPSPRQSLPRENAPPTPGGKNPDCSTIVHLSADHHHPPPVGAQETTLRAAAVSRTESVASSAPPLPSTTKEVVVARQVEARPFNDGMGASTNLNGHNTSRGTGPAPRSNSRQEASNVDKTGMVRMPPVPPLKPSVEVEPLKPSVEVEPADRLRGTSIGVEVKPSVEVEQPDSFPGA
jgi:hypothetical protein